jgi:hypothetical protein
MTELGRHFEKTMSPVMKKVLPAAFNWAFKSIPQVSCARVAMNLCTDCTALCCLQWFSVVEQLLLKPSAVVFTSTAAEEYAQLEAVPSLEPASKMATATPAPPSASTS